MSSISEQLWRTDSVLSICKFRNSDLVPERQLDDAKWFDYRFMTPWKATELFQQSYQKIYHQKFQRGVKTDVVENAATVKPLREIARADLTSFWKARQFADRLGVPYDIFLIAAFNALLSDSRPRKPRINQFLAAQSRSKITDYVKKYWDECRQAQLRFSRLPAYREESFRKQPAQIAHREWVLGEVRAKLSAKILGECFVNRILPEDTATLEFGEKEVEAARAEAALGTRMPVEPAAELEMLRSCYALQGAYDGFSRQCQRCALLSLCGPNVVVIQQFLKKQFGTDSPVDQRRLVSQRKRTRKSRAVH